MTIQCQARLVIIWKVKRLRHTVLIKDYEVCTHLVKLQMWKCRAPLIVDEDIVYSPNKYRETEGTKEIGLRALLLDQFQKNG